MRDDNCASEMGSIHQPLEFAPSHPCCATRVRSPRGPSIATALHRVRLISAATAKLLVFSAARPGQVGTGHLRSSMLTKRQWITLFEEHGLVQLRASHSAQTPAALSAEYSDCPLSDSTALLLHCVWFRCCCRS